MLPPLPNAIHEKMNRALRHQMDAEFPDAKRLYEEVLRDRWENPDALSMLSLVEYNLKNIDIAMQLAEESVRLAPSVPAIRKNANIIHHAWGLRKFRNAIFDPDSDAHPIKQQARPLIHIYQIAGNPSGGTEWHIIDLAHRLREFADVVIWTQHSNLSEIFTRDNEILVIDESRGIFPHGGTLLIAGSYHRVGAWFKDASFRRIIVLCNIVEPLGLSALLEQICLPGNPKVELLFASDWLRDVTGLPGFFEPSPINTDLLAPQHRPPTAPARKLFSRIFPFFGQVAASERTDKEDSEFVVGRLSRGDPMKFHSGATSFYKSLVSERCSVRLMGADPVVSQLKGHMGIEILPNNSMPAVDFLRSLDCFTYRTNPSWTEAWGRVVTEAMSVGLPVVVHANGGYAQVIRHGKNGFLFHRDEEALELIQKLHNSPELRKIIGANARQTILDLCSKDGFKRHVQFYLQ